MHSPRKLGNCATCAEAEINPATHSFNAGCLDCTARHLSHLQIFFECQQARVLTEPYMKAIKSYFGDDWKAWHEVVKGWAVRIKAVRK